MVLWVSNGPCLSRLAFDHHPPSLTPGSLAKVSFLTFAKVPRYASVILSSPPMLNDPRADLLGLPKFKVLQLRQTS